MSKKRIAFIILGLLLIALAGYLLTGREIDKPTEPIADPEPAEPDTAPQRSVLGTSVNGHEIEVYTFGDGETHAVFVGGIHGGYEWNSVLLAYEVIDYLKTNPEVIPHGVRISVIPSLNPDGVELVIGTTGRFSPEDAPPVEQTTQGRFNANGVDLNRNFDCNWAPTSTWRGDVVSAGTEAFSEPEAAAFRDFTQNTNLVAAVFWHSAAGAVYGSECNSGILPGTVTVMDTYAEAAGYPAIPSFDHYEISGDVEGWLATLGIPAITVELTDHESLELERNKAGVKALLEHFADL